MGVFLVPATPALLDAPAQLRNALDWRPELLGDGFIRKSSVRERNNELLFARVPIHHPYRSLSVVGLQDRQIPSRMRAERVSPR